jgi:hypothetical protein
MLFPPGRRRRRPRPRRLFATCVPPLLPRVSGCAGRVPGLRQGHGLSLIVGSAYHKNTNAKVERANGVIGDTLRAFANGRKDDWDRQLPFAVFTINNVASTLGDWAHALLHRQGGASAPAAVRPALRRRPGRDTEWLRAVELLHCPEKVAEYDAAAPRRRRAGRRPPPAGAAVVPAGVDPLPSVGAVPLLAPAESLPVLATPGEVRTGKALVGRSILYLWPSRGWVRGRVVLLSRAAAGFSHVVRYARRGFGPLLGGGGLLVGQPLAWPCRSVGDALPSLGRPFKLALADDRHGSASLSRRRAGRESLLSP